MTDPNNLTPPPELVQQWMDIWYRAKVRHVGICSFVATQAARWGYGQAIKELETFLEKGNDKR